MNSWRFFIILFFVVFGLTWSNYEADATVAYNGLVYGYTGESPDPNRPGEIKSFNYYWPWSGTYGNNELDFVWIQTRLLDIGTFQVVDDDQAYCPIDCLGPGSDVWVNVPVGTAQYVTTEHVYDIYFNDNEVVQFWTASNPHTATELYFCYEPYQSCNFYDSHVDS